VEQPTSLYSNRAFFIGGRILPGRTWVIGYEIINYDIKGG
jgi:hypothetical protein